MHRIRLTQIGLVALTAVLLLPSGVFAQDGSIAGVAADETGAVLPGVTVEASSPALIEGVRVAVTDGAGRFEISALRPGSYAVTFTLAGFNTFVRDGIELTAGFTANVDGTMTIGSIEETVTVSGAAPLIDVQNVVSQQNLSREQLDVLPTGKTYWGYAALTVGMNTNIAGGGHDVGGSIGDAWGHVSIHGSSSSDGAMEWDGMTFNNAIGDTGGSSKQFFLNQVAIQEIVMSTSNMSAEQAYGGVGINAIPKEGGNEFSYYVNVSGTNGNLANDNVNADLNARGITTSPKIKKIWDYGVGMGGPIVKDRIWFYTAHRWWGTQNELPSSFQNLTPHSPFYTPDLDNPSFTDFYNRDNSIRFTVQAAEKHKLTLSQHFQKNCACNFWTQYGVTDFDAAVDFTYWPINLTQTTWTFPASNRLLFEAGGSFLRNLTSPRRQPNVRPDDIAVVTFVPFFNHNVFAAPTLTSTPALYGVGHDFPNYVFRGSMSYVTGSHNLKVGFNTLHADENHERAEVQNALRFDFFTPTFPLQVTQYSHPLTSNQSSNQLGIYAQDQWTIDRVTLNLGVRYDHLNAYVPVQTKPAGRFVGSFTTERIENVPNYDDISPRLGAAYDLSGDGRTAVKASFGRYVLAVGTSIAQAMNPMEASITETSRSWGDAAFQGGNGNFIPDCDFDNFAANGECGAVRNPEFGTPQVVNTYDPDLLEGWGKREYQWQGSVSLQHELVDGWSVEAGYFRTSYGNFRVTDNRNIGPEDFSEYSIVAPVDSRLGSFSGATLDGLYTITPAGQAAGQDNFITAAENFAGGENMTQVFHGIDLTFSGRFDNGANLGGGISSGSTSFDECFIIDSPEQARPGHCNISQPWSAGTQFKLNGSYPLPGDAQVSFVFQNLAGLPWESIYQAGADPAEKALIEGQLGRPLAVSSEEIQLFPAGSGEAATFNFTGSEFYEDRLTQLDLRFTKIFQFGNARIRGWFDIFNVFNANSASNLVANYSPDVYPSIAQVMGGRLFKFGGQFDF